MEIGGGKRERERIGWKCGIEKENGEKKERKKESVSGNGRGDWNVMGDRKGVMEGMRKARLSGCRKSLNTS